MMIRATEQIYTVLYTYINSENVTSTSKEFILVIFAQNVPYRYEYFYHIYSVRVGFCLLYIDKMIISVWLTKNFLAFIFPKDRH